MTQEIAGVDRNQLGAQAFDLSSHRSEKFAATDGYACLNTSTLKTATQTISAPTLMNIQSAANNPVSFSIGR